MAVRAAGGGIMKGFGVVVSFNGEGLSVVGSHFCVCVRGLYSD